MSVILYSRLFYKNSLECHSGERTKWQVKKGDFYDEN